MELTNISDIKQILSESGFRFSKSMGQNFLAASWVPERIVNESGISKETGVLEIGPGIGCLTEKLAEKARRVVSIELDSRLESVLSRTLSGRGNVEIVFGDALKLNIPELCYSKMPEMKISACANLPYNITSPAIIALLKPRLFETVTVMVQREVADRICAMPGEGAFGAFTLFCGWHAAARKLFDVPPNCFYPAPKVTSTVLRFDTLKKPPIDVRDEAAMFKLVRAAFGQRRKTLVNALLGGVSGLGREKITDALSAMGLSEMIRGERLGLAEYASLSDVLFSECKA